MTDSWGLLCFLVWVFFFRILDAASKWRYNVIMARKKSVLSMYLFQGTALIIPKRHHFHHFTMLTSCLPFNFPPCFFFIYDKENSCIINAYGKCFQNDRFTVQKWFVFHYRWEVWRNAYFYEQSNKIYFCPTLSNYIYDIIYYIYILTLSLKDS